MGVVINGFVAGVLGLTLNFGAYLAELFRSGIQSVDAGQYEAARALGLRRICCRRHCARSFPRWATTRWCLSRRRRWWR